MTTPRASEAYAAWYAAKREFDAALPWTAEWLRLRLIEQELRSEWERLALDDTSMDWVEMIGRADSAHHADSLPRRGGG